MQEAARQGMQALRAALIADSRKNGPHSHSSRELTSANKKNDLGNRFPPELSPFATLISAL